MGRLLRQKTDTNLITFKCVAALFIKHHSWRLQRQHILTQFPRVSKYVLRTWNPNSAKPGFQETGYCSEFYNFFKFCTQCIINGVQCAVNSVHKCTWKSSNHSGWLWCSVARTQVFKNTKNQSNYLEPVFNFSNH